MQFERNNKLITSKFWQYFFPTVMSVFAANMAVVVDSVIVSSLIGVEALSGLQILFPFIAFLDLLCWMIGLGGSLLCAAAKANFDEKEANRIYSVANVSVVAIGIIIMIIGLLFPDMIIGWLSNSVTPNVYALDYFRMYTIGIPFFCFMLSMFYYVGTDGMPEFTSKALIIASILDPLFDIILIYFFNMGMAGSGLATSISFIGGSLFLSLYFFKPNRTFKMVKVKFAIAVKDFIQVCKSGFGGASVQLYLVISTLFCNSVIISLMGDQGLMSQEICTSVLLIISIFFIGLVETVSPMLSVYHQDNDYSAIDYLIKISIKFIAIVGVIFAAISFLFPEVILMLYSVKMQYASMVTDAIRLYGLSFLTIGFAFFYIFYTQAIQKNKLSNIVSISYNLILVVTMLVILPKIFGNNGVWITQFCVGVITLLGIVIYSRYLNKKSNGEYHGIFINKSHGDNIWEYTINANASEVYGLVSVIKNKLGDNKLSDITCMSLDEFLNHIIETNEELDTIDVLLDVGDKAIKIYIKDLGAERTENFTFKYDDSGYNRKLNQTCVIGLNSTLITIEN
ncbi:MATE family efflux transporter [Methanobrevibacter sp.]|uniref:MATE family efflux transporter n=1 Tax=Methanobrevibacter sp. TaxID=66852 RepID=UPI00386D31ED